MSDEEWDEEPGLTLASIENGHNFNINIRSTYASHWGPVEAFRELVQNWRDAIIRSFGLRESQFHVTRHETTTETSIEILYKATNPTPTSPASLGYIRFSGSRRKTGDSYTGFVDITNHSAALEPSYLEIGGTTKARDEDMAGAHGEGMKIALLVLQRGEQNHSVKCHATSFKWNFNFTNRGKLVARLRRMSKTPKQLSELISQARRDFNAGKVPFEASPYRDVQFIIGGPVAGSRDEWGMKKKRQYISLESFKDWCKAALFFQEINDDDILRTSAGDLIFDARLCGNIYLKGLLLQESTTDDSTDPPVHHSASITGKQLKFSYNFREAKTNRERQTLSNPVTECTTILKIWDLALRIKPQYVDRLHDMLISSVPEYADVSQAGKAMPQATAGRLKKLLLSDPAK